MSSKVLSDDTDASGHGAWSKASSRKRRKKTLSQYKKVGQVANNSIVHNVSILQNRPSRPNNAGGAAQKGQKKVVICESSTSVLKASETLQIPKAVYRLGNINARYSVTDVRSYITLLGIQVLTGFELKPTQRQPGNNKSFRLCNIAEDTDKLINGSNRDVGISIHF